jgi:hypothetical protein
LLLQRVQVRGELAFRDYATLIGEPCRGERRCNYGELHQRDERWSECVCKPIH